MTGFRGKPRVVPPEEALRSTVVRPGITHWVTKDGRYFRPEDMEPSHRLNTLNFVVRRISDRYNFASLATVATQAMLEAVGDTDLTTLEDEADELLFKSMDAECCWAAATRRWPVLYKIRALVGDDKVWTPADAFASKVKQ